MITVSAPPPKISGEQYISHSPIKLYTFDDPKIVLKHNNGFWFRGYTQIAARWMFTPVFHPAHPKR